MAQLFRYRLTLIGFEGAPGYSILHSTTGDVIGSGAANAGNFMNQIRNCWETMKGNLAPGVQMSIDPEVSVIDVATGDLAAPPQAITPPPAVTSSGTDGHMSRGVMAVCKHHTDGFSDRHHVITGRTFFGPIAGGVVNTSGNIEDSVRVALAAAWDGMLDIAGETRLVVYHRPARQYTKPDGSVVPASVGSFGHVQSVTVNQEPGLLRSRAH